MGLKERFCRKIHDELKSFKKEILRESKSDIMNASYKTEVIINLYEVLLESVENFSDALLNNLLTQGTNVLESLYNDFISDSSEDVLYEDLKLHIDREFEEAEDGSCMYLGHGGGVL